jgi:glycosyltransferase involved in cell wall biosynthesis
MTVVSDLGGSGGAERLFAALHEFLRHTRRIDVTLVTASSSLPRLQAAGRLADADGVVALPLGAHPGRGRLGVIRMTLQLLAATLGRRFDLVHICLPSPVYAPYAAVVCRLPDALRPKVALTVIDCTVAPSLAAPPPPGTYERQVLDAHRLYAKWVQLDGMFSWYRAFVEAASRHLHVAGTGLVRAARFCFSEPGRFSPAPVKDRVMIFAGRLSEQTRPLLFVDAVAALRAREPALIDGWRFELDGRGVLQTQVEARIAAHGLGAIVRVTHAIDLAPILARSQVFVSTQAIENFTSLAMLEAMAAGNAVIAEDVGQTSEFVRHGINGFLVAPATADTLADAMADYLRHPERHAAMAAASRSLVTDVHTIDHFADDILSFWHDVIASTR